MSGDAFDAAHSLVLKWEGGAVDDPHDPGGYTIGGISLRALVAAGLDFNADGRVDRADLEAMTPEERRAFYRGRYWTPVRGDRLPAPLALLVYDCAVNQGVRRASRILQRAAGARPDGIVGPRTLDAVWRAWRREDGRWILVEVASRRFLHYSSLSLFARYGRGWSRRLVDVACTAERWRALDAPSVPPMPRTAQADRA